MPLVLVTETDPGEASWVDASTLGIGSGNVIWKPAGPADPDLGIYTTWEDAHAAAVALQVPLRTIWVDSPGVTASIEPAGEYSMSRIVLRGFLRATVASSAPTSYMKVETAVGVTFTAWQYGIYDLWLDHLGTDPLMTYSTNEQFLTVNTGERNIYESSGNAAVVFRVQGAGAVVFTVGDGSAIVGDGVTDYEVFEAMDTATVQLNLYDNVFLTQNCLRSAAGATINLKFVGVLDSFSLTQTAAAGTLDTADGADGVFYDGTGVDWSGVDPGTVKSALDRIAAHAGPIP